MPQHGVGEEHFEGEDEELGSRSSELETHQNTHYQHAPTPSTGGI